MPIPTPNEDESREDFISRCMEQLADDDEFDDQDQRAGVCFSKWREHKQ